MTPLEVRYEDAYAKAFPFNKLVDGMLQEKMIEETARWSWYRLRYEEELENYDSR